MKGALIAVALILFISGNAMAKDVDYKKWFEMSEGYLSPLVRIDDGGFTYIVMNENDKKEISVAFQFVDTDEAKKTCKKYEPGIFNDTYPIDINGTWVKASFGCSGNGRINFYPDSDKGREFLFNELKTKEKVTINGAVSYSTVGFDNSYKELKERLDKYKIAI
ncbi:hypothetical protein [Photobacterium indicum]|uniref:Uncharacterized protein n=1 Tax=Photobacterium indicum TaxID=81447 RepID=A0A2T3L3F2_9GAMM|nr:hypothetical protein [Photobacterium indicum]PSV43617.1 hypothetical protein C9J47_22375 [Photobacterium indicum]